MSEEMELNNGLPAAEAAGMEELVVTVIMLAEVQVMYILHLQLKTIHLDVC